MSTKTQSMPRLIQAMKDAFSLPDLRNKILFTLGMLIIFRLVAHVPMPGVNTGALATLFENVPLLGMLDLFSGGALRNFSVAAMGVYPYITATIIMTVLVPVIPKLQAISMEGESGRNKISLISHWLTVPIGALSAYGQITFMKSQGVLAWDIPALTMVTMIISMIAGTMFLIWLGELITSHGIGNGISIIIFSGIVAGYPQGVGQAALLSATNMAGVIFFFIILLATVVLIVYFTEAHRRIPVQYAKSVFRGGRMYKQSGATHIPIRVNTAGMIPLIFAMSLAMFPGIIATYFMSPEGAAPNFANTIYNWFNPSMQLPIGLFYWGLFFLLTVGFAFFYTYIIFQQQDLPGNLQKQGGFIPGIRPGGQTKKYLDGVIGHITWGGALFLGLVGVIPFLAFIVTTVDLPFSSMGLIIVVGVVLDTMKQLEAQLVMRRYEGFIK
ncbi:MAG TPA: preprotein translocase subunit SecY [Dehalococcoidales bacterium]|nr:preprotein translocase subunit SecY [Dehalococcoidales bacterium]